MRILVSNLGDGVELGRNLLDGLNQYQCQLLVANSTPSPSSYLSEVNIPPLGSNVEEYVNRLIRLCNRHAVSLLIPGSDREVAIIAARSREFSSVGTMVLAPTDRLAYALSDRDRAMKVLRAIDAPMPNWMLNSPTGWEGSFTYPVVVRSAIDRRVPDRLAESRDELQQFLDRQPLSAIVDRGIDDRYELDCAIARGGSPLEIVVRQHLADGIWQVADRPDLIEGARAIFARLPEAFGLFTLEAYGNKFVDLIPTFVPGICLSIWAGSNFPLYILELFMGIHCDSQQDIRREFKVGAQMMNYPQPIYFEKDAV